MNLRDIFQSAKNRAYAFLRNLELHRQVDILAREGADPVKSLQDIEKIGTQLRNFIIFMRDQPASAQDMTGIFISNTLIRKGRPEDLQDLLETFQDTMQSLESLRGAEGDEADRESLDSFSATLDKIKGRIDFLAMQFENIDPLVLGIASDYYCKPDIIDEIFADAFPTCGTVPSQINYTRSDRKAPVTKEPSPS